MERITPIFHLTDQCNLRCDYCYVYKSGNSIRLCESNIDKIVIAMRKIIAHNKPRPTRIILHGGEPLLISPLVLSDFFRKIRDIDEQTVFSLQTNLTLINEQFCKLFKQYNVHVGFSLDGCDADQNKCRKDYQGNSSFERVMEKYCFSKENGVSAGAIVTVNKSNIGGEQQLLNFINNNGLKCDIRPAFPTSNSGICMTPKEYAIFFNHLFDLWYEDEKCDTFLISDFESEIREIIGGAKECRGCTKSENCGKNFISIDSEGNCYPCNRLYGIADFNIGNLFELSLDEVLKNGKKITAQRWEILRKSECLNCEIADYCHGGCPAIAYFVYNDYNKKDYFCESFRLIKEHVRKKLVDS